MDDLEIGLIDYEEYLEYFRDNDKYEYAMATDFAILSGVDADNSNRGCFWCSNFENIHSNYDPLFKVVCVNNLGFERNVSASKLDIGVRPTIKYSQIKDCLNPKSVARIDEDIVLFKFGQYPQYLVDEELNETLEHLFSEDKIKKTGKYYTTASPHYSYDDFTTASPHYSYDDFTPSKHYEYEYEGNKYVRVLCTYLPEKKYDNLKFDVNKYSGLWVKVAPITWMGNLDDDIAMTSRIILSGVRFLYKSFNGVEEKKEDIEFKDTSIFKFLKTYLVNDIIPENLILNSIKYRESDYKKNFYNESISKKFK